MSEGTGSPTGSTREWVEPVSEWLKYTDPSGKVRLIDRGWGSFEDCVLGLNDEEVILGIWSKRRVAGKGFKVISIGEYAQRLEMGWTKNGKKWPFLSRTVRENKDDWAQDMADRVNRAMKRKSRTEGKNPFVGRAPDFRTARRILHNMGKVAVRDVKKTIMSIHEPALEPSTVALKAMKGRKSPAKPLIDTGALHDSVEYRISKKQKD